MKKNLLSKISFAIMIVMLVLAGLPVKTAQAAARTASVSGNWSNTATWGGSAVPVAGDTVTINSGITVTLDVNTAAITSLTINAMTAGGTNGLSVGTYTLNTGSITINGSGTANRFSTISVSTGTINVSGNITFGGTAAQARLTFSGSGTLNIGGNLGTGGTFAASTGTVNFNGSSAQTAAGYTYNIIKSNNTAGVTLLAASTITTLTIGDITTNSVFNDGGFVITPGASSVLNLTSGTYNLGSATVATTWPAWGTRNIASGTTVGYISSIAQTVSATPAYQNLTLGGALAKTITGLTSVAGNLVISGTCTVTLPNGFSIGGNLAIDTSSGTGLTLASATTITVTGDVSGGGTITAGTSGRVFNVTGNWTFNGSIAIGDAITLNLTGTGDQTLSGVISNGTTVGALIIDKAGGKVTLGSAINSGSGTFTLTAGTFDASTYLLTANGTTTLTAGTLRAGASTWALNYSFTPTPPAGFTIDYYNNNPTINAAITYQNLVFSGTGTAGASGALIIQGNLTNTGGGTLNFGANGVTLSGTVATNSIAGFTTTGVVSMTKTSGTATFAGNVNGGGLTINGSGGTLDLGASLIHTFTGTWTRTNGILNGGSSTLRLGNTTAVSGTGGTFTANAGTVEYYGSGAQTIAALNYNNLTSSSSGARTLASSGTIGVAGTFTPGTNSYTITGSTVDFNGSGAQSIPAFNYNNLTSSSSGARTLASSGTIGVAGIFTPGTNSYTITGSTVNFNGSSSQSIPAFNYNNLSASNGGTKTSAGAISVNSNLVVGDGTTFSHGAYALTVTGTTTVGAGTSGNLTIASATGTKVFTGLVTINTGATWNNSGNSALTFRGGITSNPTFNGGSGVHTFDTNSQALTGPFIIPSVQVTGVTLTNNNSLNVGTALSGTGGLTQAAGSTLQIGGTSGITTLTATAIPNTVNYDGGTQTVHGNNYYHLSLLGSGTKTLETGTTAIAGNLSLSNINVTAVTDLGINGFVSLGSGSTFNASSFNHTVGGNWTNNDGTFTPGTGTVTFNGSGAQNINGTATSQTFNNIVINNSSGSLSVTGNTTTLTVNNLTVTTGNFSAPATLNITGNFTFTAGTFNASTNTNIGGNWMNNGGTFYANSQTVTFNGTGPQVIGGTDIDQSFRNLVINKSGGTLSLGDGMTNLTIFGNLTQTSGGFTAHDTMPTVCTLDIIGNFTQTAGTFTAGTNTSIVGNWTNSAGAFDANGGTVRFDGAAQPIPAFTYYHLTTGGSGTKTLAGAAIVAGDLTIGFGTELDVSASNYALSIAGDWDNTSATFTPRSGTVTFNGAAPQTIGANAPLAFYNLTINNSSGIPLFALITVNNTLTFTSGRINIPGGGYYVTLPTSATVVGAGPGKYVYGSVKRPFTSDAASFNFPVGDASYYAPFELSFASVSTGGSVFASVGNIACGSPDIAQSLNVNHCWQLTNSGVVFSTYDATFDFADGGATVLDSGAATAEFIVGKYDGSTWTYPTVGTKTSTTTQATGMDSMSVFEVGESSKLSQTITVDTAAPGSAIYNNTFGVAASASSGLDVSITTSGGCSGSGTNSATITMTSGTTTCVVHYNQGGNGAYKAAPEVTSNTTAEKAAGSVTINNIPGTATFGGNFTPTFTKSGNGTASVASLTSATCTVTSGVVDYVGSGTCTLQASVTAGTNHLAATGAEQSFTIDKAAGSVTINNIPGTATFGGNFTPTFTKSGNGTASVASLTSATCTVTSGVVDYVGSGTCTLQASVTAGTNHLAATGAEQSFTIDKAAGSVTINNIPGTATFGGNFTPTFTKSGNGTASVASLTSATCTVTSGVVDYVGSGTCTLQASVTAGTNHLAATGAEQSFTIDKAAGSVSINNIPGTATFGGNFTPTFTKSGNGTASVASLTSATCTVTSGVVDYVGSGTCTLQASVTAGTNHLAATGAEQSFTIDKAAGSVTINNIPGTATFGGNFTPTFTKSGDGTASVASLTSATCTVTSGVVDYVGSGTCTLQASVTAGTNHLAATGAEQSFTIDKAAGSVTINNIPGTATFGGNFTPTFTKSGNGTASVASLTSATCTVTSGVVDYVGSGTCTLQASVTAGTNHLAATGAEQSFTIDKAAGSVTINNIPGTATFGGNFTPTFTKSGNGTASVASLTSATCTVTSGVVDYVGSGTCTLQASVTAGTNHLAATGAEQSFTIDKAAGSVTINNIPGTATFGGNFTPTFTKSGNGTASVASLTSATCTVTSGVVDYVGSGTCTLQASVTAGTNHLAATGAEQSFTIDKAAGSVTINNIPGTATFGGNFTPTFTKSGNGTASVASLTSATCTVTSGVVDYVGSGTCTLQASVTAGTNHLAATGAEQSFTIDKAAGSVTINNIPGTATFGGNFTPTFTKSGNGTASVASLTSATCTVTSGVVDYVGSGTCTLQASVTAGTNHLAATGAEQSFTIDKAAGSVTINNIPGTATFGGNFTPTFTKSGNGTASVASLTSATCTVTSGVVDYVGSGTCTLQASVTAGTNHLAATGAEQSFTIDKAAGSVTINNIPGTATFGGNFTPTFTKSGNGTASVASLTSATCTVTSGVVDYVGSGTCTLQASVTAGTNHLAATGAEQSFTIDKAAGSVTINNIPGTATFGGNFTPTFTKSGNGTASVASLTSATCTVTSGVVDYVGSGTCTLQASVTAGTNHLAATGAEQSFTIDKAAGSVTINNIPGTATFGGNFTPTFTKSGDGTASVASLTSATCTVTSGVVDYVGSGTCTLQASVTAGTNHLAATGAEQSFTIDKAAGSVTINNIPGTATFGGNFTPTFTKSGNGTASVASLTSATCTVTSGVVDYVGSGTCTLQASVTAGTNHLAATGAEQSFTIDKAAGSVSINNIPGTATFGGNFTPTFTKSGNGTASVASLTSATCTVTSGVVDYVGSGTCTLQASVTAGTNHLAATGAEQSFTIDKASQAITFTSTEPTNAIVGDTYIPTATGGASGNAVTFAIDVSSSAVCSLSSGTVTFDAEGACRINADQAGNANYFAAPQVHQDVGVGLTHQTTTEITNAVALGTPTVVGQSYAVNFSVLPKVTGTPTGNVQVSDGSATCTGTVAAGTCDLTSTAVGIKSISASYEGDSTFGGSTSSAVSHTVNKADADVTTWPAATSITYGQTLADSILSGGVATPAGSFAFTTPSTAPNAGTAVQSVTYTPADTTNYNPVVGSVSVTVDKANSDVTTWPTATAITYGQTLASSILSGGVATPAGSFAFTTPSTAPNAGTASHSVTFTPTNSANYYSATGSASVTVNKASQTILFTSTAPVSAVVGGTYVPAATGGASGNEVIFEIDASATAVCSLSAGTVTFNALGQCVINANQAGNDNYFAASQAQQSFAVIEGIYRIFLPLIRR